MFAESVAGIFQLMEGIYVNRLAIGLILCFTTLNSHSIRAGARLGKTLITPVFLGTGAIVLFGLTNRHVDGLQATSLGTGIYFPPHFNALVTAMLAAFRAYQDWATICFIGGEINDATINRPLGLMGGMRITICMYGAANFPYWSSLTTLQVAATQSGFSAIAAVEAVRVFWDAKGALSIALLIGVTTMGCTHANSLACCRT